MISEEGVGGKGELGGEGLGEMEVWGMEGLGGGDVVEEMLSMKCDEVVGGCKG